MKVRHRFRIVFAGKILRYLVHRAWPEKRYSGYKVFKAARLELQHELLHSGAFKLEHSVRIGCGYKLIHRLILVALKLLIRHMLSLFAYKFKRVAYYGKRPQPDEVHFQKPELLYYLLIELGRDYVVVSL